MQNKYKLLQGLQPIIYPTIPLHMVYGDDNIGDNGENLSIIVLSCQRAQNTIKLMKSIQEHIPNFLGELIIGDNGSNIDTLKSLNDCIKDLTYKCRLVEFGQNFGVAKGRNMAINQASKEYIMNVDNDIYFTMNLLPEIHNTFSQFGCHFLNLPLISYDKENLFAIGGTLFASLSDGFIHSG
ncbi:MAG: glycosyltransferase, partial [Clostridia bacterium]